MIMFSSRARAAIRKSDRKAAQILGVTITRDAARALSRPEPSGALSFSDGDDDSEHRVVWDVLDPFGPPHPIEQHIRALLQPEIDRMRRRESIGPLQPLPDDSASEHESDSDPEDITATDADDEDENESGDTHDRDDDRLPHAAIALPCLLHARPLCDPVSPSPSPSFSSSCSSLSEDLCAPWLAHKYPDIAEAEEHARKARRDAYRSRLKALAILGPEAASAIANSLR